MKGWVVVSLKAFIAYACQPFGFDIVVNRRVFLFLCDPSYHLDLNIPCFYLERRVKDVWYTGSITIYKMSAPHHIPFQSIFLWAFVLLRKPHIFLLSDRCWLGSDFRVRRDGSPLDQCHNGHNHKVMDAISYRCPNSNYHQISNIRRTESQNLNVSHLVLQLSLCKYWSQMLSREWRCSWSSADRRCSN